MADTIWENKYIPWKDAQIGGKQLNIYLFTAEQMREAIRRAVEDKRHEYEATNHPPGGALVASNKIMNYVWETGPTVDNNPCKLLGITKEHIAMEAEYEKLLAERLNAHLFRHQTSTPSCSLVKDENGLPHSFKDAVWGWSLP